jgi:lysophospholipase L1-like esterase
MGWGVNDGETFASLIASSIEAPVLNLGVASYGTVREILRVRMQPRFQDANCIVIQYSWNDFDENSVFLARGALPSPTRKRFQLLVSDYGKRDVSFQDVLIRTFDLMLNYPLAFFLNVIGWHDFPLEDDDPMNMNGTPREETEDTKAFLAVLASFPELSGKKIFVMGPGRFISALSRETAPVNVFPLPVDLNDGDWYTLDMHPNKEGHRQMAAQILQQLKRTEEGRQCLAGAAPHVPRIRRGAIMDACTAIVSAIPAKVSAFHHVGHGLAGHVEQARLLSNRGWMQVDHHRSRRQEAGERKSGIHAPPVEG